MVFPQDDWTLNQVDATNTAPGPFQEHTQYPYGRHGGFSADELYVPLIMAGPAFKSGVLLPHPVLHPEVAPTALATLGKVAAKRWRLRTAARGAIQAAMVGDPGETIAVPDPPDGARDLVLTGSGFEGTPPAPDGAGDQRDRARRRGPLRRRALRRRRHRHGGGRLPRAGGDGDAVRRLLEPRAATGRSPSTRCSPAATRWRRSWPPPKTIPTITFPPGPGPAGHAAAREPRRRSRRLRRLARADGLRRRQPVRRRRGARA